MAIIREYQILHAENNANKKANNPNKNADNGNENADNNARNEVYGIKWHLPALLALTSIYWHVPAFTNF